MDNEIQEISTEIIIPYSATAITISEVYNVEEGMQNLYEKVKMDCPLEHIDWGRKTEEERESIIWVRMLQIVGVYEDKLQVLEGAVQAHIQDNDLMRYHPGYPGWESFDDMLRQVLGNPNTGASRRSDLAFIHSNIVPIMLEMPTPLEQIPSLSNLRTLVPSLRIAQRQHDTQRIYNLLEQATHMTNDNVEAMVRDRPSPSIVGHAHQGMLLVSCSVEMNPTEFATLRRITSSLIDWQYT
jgi:hypothetical protein